MVTWEDIKKQAGLVPKDTTPPPPTTKQGGLWSTYGYVIKDTATGETTKGVKSRTTGETITETKYAPTQTGYRTVSYTPEKLQPGFIESITKPQETAVISPEKVTHIYTTSETPGIRRSVTTEEMIIQAEKEQARQDIARAWEDRYVAEKEKFLISHPEQTFGFTVSEQLGLTQTKTLLRDPILAEKTGKFIIEHPEDIITSVSAGLLIWPLTTGQEVGRALKRGNLVEAGGIIAGTGIVLVGTGLAIKGAGSLKKTIVEWRAPRTSAEVKIDLSRSAGFSISAESPTKAVSIGNFQLTEGQLKGVKGGVFTVTRSGGPARTVADTLVVIPEQTVGKVTIGPTVDMSYSKSITKTISGRKVTGAVHGPEALDLPQAGGIIHREIIGDPGYSLGVTTLEMERAGARITGTKSAYGKVTPEKVTVQVQDWLDIRFSARDISTKLPDKPYFEAPKSTSGVTKTVTPGLETHGKPAIPEKITLKVEGKTSQIAKITGVETPATPKYISGLGSISALKTETKTKERQEKKVTAGISQVLITDVTTARMRDDPILDQGVTLIPDITQITEQTTRTVPATTTTTIPDLTTTTTTTTDVPRIPERGPPGVPFFLPMPLNLGGLGKNRKARYGIKVVRNPVPEKLKVDLKI